MTQSYITSFDGLFARHSGGAPPVDRVEIPLIQRDYAQGRQGEKVARIRTAFLDALHAAVTGGNPISLDFVYGEVEGGTLRPLDGQQRLTTLFLLHWYLAFRAGTFDEVRGWKHFTYATRPSARVFCERLVGCRPPGDVAPLSAWIADQSWCLHTWSNDPTIKSMLVMLDAIAARFCDDDCSAAWERLVHAQSPAITFHLLPIEQKEMGPSEDLYIKMNSRGKPLTPFENFKARFEQLLERVHPARLGEFAVKVDGAWADVLWPYRGADSIVDDEFLGYFHFVTELCSWREGALATSEIAGLADYIYGESARSHEHLLFLIRAFDTWVGVDVSAAFAELFATERALIVYGDTPRVVLFNPKVDLFEACCRDYQLSRRNNRAFTLQQTLLLYAVLLHRIHATEDFPRRLRVIRNLIEASGSELRESKMPALLRDVERIAVDGDLDGVTAFNPAQTQDERLKRELLRDAPQLAPVLYELEDDPLLRGSVACFELDPVVFEHRAKGFQRVFSGDTLLKHVTSALLAMGDYARTSNWRFFQLGAASGQWQRVWREVLAGAARVELAKSRVVLARFLDAITDLDGDLAEGLEQIRAAWLASVDPATGLDWRWYVVRYDAMRQGDSGLYVGLHGALGYQLCMLNKTQVNSYYRDPFLLAILHESGVDTAVAEQQRWFFGYETEPRWMPLNQSGTKLRCVDEGIALQPPPNTEYAGAFAKLCAANDIGEDHLLHIPQIERDGKRLDALDRVARAAALLRDLVAGGL